MGFFWRSRDSERISALDEKLEKLKRDQANLELEWTNFYDKARRMLARVSKRAEVVEKADAEEATATTPLLPIGGPNTGRLSDRQREIQQQILRRRAGG